MLIQNQNWPNKLAIPFGINLNTLTAKKKKKFSLKILTNGNLDNPSLLRNNKVNFFQRLFECSSLYLRI